MVTDGGAGLPRRAPDVSAHAPPAQGWHTAAQVAFGTPAGSGTHSLLEQPYVVAAGCGAGGFGAGPEPSVMVTSAQLAQICGVISVSHHGELSVDPPPINF